MPIIEAVRPGRSWPVILTNICSLLFVSIFLLYLGFISFNGNTSLGKEGTEDEYYAHHGQHDKKLYSLDVFESGATTEHQKVVLNYLGNHCGP